VEWHEQGDQIGRFFFYWAIFLLLGDFSFIGQFFFYWASVNFGQFL
jgi:hypothetical protein